MAHKNKSNKLLIGIIVVFLTLASIFAVVMFRNSSSGNDGQTFSVTSFDEQPDVNMIPLNVCTNEYDCMTYLKSEGMPDNFLESKGYSIYCQNGNCYFKKI